MSAYRFISEDPIGLAGGINKFVYVANNPINKKDPFGLYGESWQPGWDPTNPVIKNPPPPQKCTKCNWIGLATCLISKVPNDIRSDPNTMMSMTHCLGGDEEACQEFVGDVLVAFPDAYHECHQENCQEGTIDECGKCK
jgi:hypothetical protein